jgi:hypothetical protein
VARRCVAATCRESWYKPTDAVARVDVAANADAAASDEPAINTDDVDDGDDDNSAEALIDNVARPDSGGDGSWAGFDDVDGGGDGDGAMAISGGVSLTDGCLIGNTDVPSAAGSGGGALLLLSDASLGIRGTGGVAVTVAAVSVLVGSGGNGGAWLECAIIVGGAGGEDELATVVVVTGALDVLAAADVLAAVVVGCEDETPALPDRTDRGAARRGANELATDKNVASGDADADADESEPVFDGGDWSLDCKVFDVGVISEVAVVVALALAGGDELGSAVGCISAAVEAEESDVVVLAGNESIEVDSNSDRRLGLGTFALFMTLRNAATSCDVTCVMDGISSTRDVEDTEVRAALACSAESVADAWFSGVGDCTGASSSPSGTGSYEVALANALFPSLLLLLDN